MTQLILVLTVFFTLVMIVQMILPFLGSRDDQLSFELLDEDLREIEALVARKVALVQTLRDLEYDFETAKMSEEDYRRFKRSCELRAVAIMRRLDAIHGGRDWESAIDRTLAERLEARPQQEEPSQESESQAEESVDSSSPVADIELTCEQCGAQLEDDDRFCGKCGAPVVAQSEEVQATAEQEGLATQFSPVTSTSRPSEVTG